MANKKICKTCGKEITGTVMDYPDGSVACVTCYNLELEKNKTVSDETLEELIKEIGLAAKRVYLGKQDNKIKAMDIESALKELKIYRLQHKKRDLMIRKAQLLKQNKSLLEQQKEGKKDG